jgi:tetratricopeptide (TPR) repeat protein
MRKIWIPLIFLFSILLYVNSIFGTFLIDDTFLIRDNPFIENFRNLISYFTSGTETFGRPVRLLSFYIDTAIFGKNPIGYHLSNIIYYGIFCSLAYYFCLRFWENKILAIFTTFIFVAHPLHTEGVAYISGRKDILGGIFGFASLICFLNQNRTSRLLTILFFLLAINTKETYAILPLLYLISEYYQKKSIKQQKSFLALFFIVAFIFLLYIIFFRNRIFFDYFHTIPVYGNNQGVNFATAVKISGYIFFLSFFPFSLSADYTYNAVKRINISDPQFFVSAAILLFAVGAAYFLRFRQKEVSFGFSWMLIGLLPVCQIVPYPEIISERSLIFLSFGTCLVISRILLILHKNYARGILGILFIIFSVTTINRNKVWHDELSLWQATVKAQPDCARGHYNLGCALVKRNQLFAAEQEFLISLKINPPELITVPDYSSDALVNLGNIYFSLKNFSQAKICYQQALKCNRKNYLARHNLKIIKRIIR